MKFNLKMIAVATAMVSAGAAHAAVTSGNNGSVMLGAFNTVTSSYYLRDTGFLLNSFLPSSVTTLSGDGGGSAVTGDKTPVDGLTLTKASVGYTNFADSNFSTWLSGQTASDVRWFVSAVDSAGTSSTDRKRFITSSANASETATNGNLDGYISSSNAGGLVVATTGLFDSGSVSGISSTGSLGSASAAWGSNFGLGSDGLASLGDAVSLFYFARSTGTLSGSNAATATQYGNGPSSFATVTLAANGDFSYTLAPVSAVPVPAAAWLLGSGLLSFGAFVRRRTAK